MPKESAEVLRHRAICLAKMPIRSLLTAEKRRLPKKWYRCVLLEVIDMCKHMLEEPDDD
jgi:hypothetical protein